MKILMLNPPFMKKYSRQSRSPCVTKGGTFYYPYFLAYATGVLDNEGFEVKLLDSIAKNLSHEETLKVIKKFNPSLVVIDTSTPSIINDVDFASRIKDELKNVHINLVGTHPTYLPEETLRMSDKIDSVCIWEYDYTVRDLALALEKKKNLESVDGFCFRKGKEIIRNKPRPLIKNLDELPFISQVYKKHLDVKDYFYASVEYPQVTILTARGCPYSCTFCLTSDMPIITEKGIHRISSLVENIENLPRVLSHDGVFHKIEDVMKRYHKGGIIKLKVQGNPYELELTLNHKIYAIKKNHKNEKPKFIECRKLDIGDFVAIPRIRKTRDIKEITISDIIKIPSIRYKRGLSKLNKIAIKKIIKFGDSGLSNRKIASMLDISKSRVQTVLKNRNNILNEIKYKLIKNGEFIRYTYSIKQIKDKIPLEGDFLRLCGYFLAEGNIYTLKNRPNSKVLVLTFNKNEKKYIEDVKSIVKKYFDLDGYISDTKTAYQISVFSNVVAELFLELFNTGAPNKKIPSEWIYLPEQKQIQLLSGFLRGDGFAKYKNIGFNTTSIMLAEQFQIILNRLGFPNSLLITPKGKYESEIDGRKFRSKHDLYNVFVTGHKLTKKLNSNIRNIFKIQTKYGKKTNWFMNENYIFAPIKNREIKKYKGQVYNISVEEAHSYTINGVSVANCNSPFKGSYRPRSVKNVVEEFEFIQNELSEVREVMVEDETFPAVKSRTIELCNEMIKRKNSLKWSCNARVDTDYETLKVMKKAGCRLLCVGFESPTQEVLNSIKKGTTKNTQIEFMKNCNKLGLLVNGCFILGLPGDTKETIKRTVEFAKLLNPDTAQFYPLMVYPGLVAYEWAKQKGYLTTEDYSKWLTKEGWHNCVIDRPDLSGEELVKICDQARLEFYLRPAYFLKRLRLLLKGKGEIKRIFKASNTFFKYILTMGRKK